MSQLHSDIVKSVLELSTLDPRDRGILEDSLADSFSSCNELQLAARAIAALVDFREKHKPISPIERRVLESFLSPMHHQPAVSSTQDGIRYPTPADRVLNAKDLNKPSSSGGPQTKLEGIPLGIEPPEKANFEPIEKVNPQLLTKAILDGFSSDPSLPHSLTAEEFQKTYPYGMKQILKAGWVPGKGLGVDETGISAPLQHSSPERQSRAGIGHHNPNPSNDEPEVYDEEYYRRTNHDWSDYPGAAQSNTIQGNPSQKSVAMAKPTSVEHWQAFSEHPSVRDRAVQEASRTEQSAKCDLRLVHSHRRPISASHRGRESVVARSSDTHKGIQQNDPWAIQKQTPSNRKSRSDRWPRVGPQDVMRTARRAAAGDQAGGQVDASNNQTQETVWVNSFEQNLPSHPAERKHSNWPRSGW